MSLVFPGPIFTPPSGGGGGTLPLDAIGTSAYAAFSTRKLLSAFAGSPLSGYNGTNSADVGFSGNDLDLTALAARGTNVSMNIWYDQSGNGRDLAYSAGNRPPIRSSSTNVTLNGKACWNFDKTQGTVTGGAQNTSTCRTVFAAVYIAGLGQTGTIIGGDSGSGGLQVRLETNGALGLVKQGVTNIGNSSAADVAATNGYVLVWQYNASGGAYQFWRGSTSLGSGTNSQSISAAAIRLAKQWFANEEFEGKIAELIIFDTSGAMNSTDRATLVSDMQSYWGL